APRWPRRGDASSSGRLRAQQSQPGTHRPASATPTTSATGSPLPRASRRQTPPAPGQRRSRSSSPDLLSVRRVRLDGSELLADVVEARVHARYLVLDRPAPVGPQLGFHRSQAIQHAGLRRGAVPLIDEADNALNKRPRALDEPPEEDAQPAERGENGSPNQGPELWVGRQLRSSRCEVVGPDPTHAKNERGPPLLDVVRPVLVAPRPVP